MQVTIFSKKKKTMQVTHLSQIHILMINNFGPPTHQYETKSNMKNKNFEL